MITGPGAIGSSVPAYPAYPAADTSDTTASASSQETGPSLLHLDEGWTPQGQGYDAKRHEVLTTYYTDTNDNGEGDTVRLSVQDQHTGVEARDVVLLGLKEDGSDRPGHGGGVATNGKFIYVADTDAVYVYRRSAIDKADYNPDTGRYEAKAIDVIEMPDLPPHMLDEVVAYDGGSCQDLRSPASYMTIHGDQAFVGSWSPDGDGLSGSVYRFDIDPQTGALVNPTGPIKAPDQSQGFTVVDGGNGLLFSSNHETNKLVYQPITHTENEFSASPDDREVLDSGELIGSYVEEINIIDGELWVTYESGAQQYDGEDGRQTIQRIPLEELGDLPFET